jgi:murein L,D-transpeptidase YafK
MLLMSGDQVIRRYHIALGRDPVGHKRAEGDKRTPEGRYFVDGRNPHSRYHLSLHLSYPNADDIRRAAASGVRPGRDIAIHGLPVGDLTLSPAAYYDDWTDGCIAVSDPDIEEIWSLVPDGATVDIRP